MVIHIQPTQPSVFILQFCYLSIIQLSIRTSERSLHSHKAYTHQFLCLMQIVLCFFFVLILQSTSIKDFVPYFLLTNFKSMINNYLSTRTRKNFPWKRMFLYLCLYVCISSLFFCTKRFLHVKIVNFKASNYCCPAKISHAPARITTEARTKETKLIHS